MSSFDAYVKLLNSQPENERQFETVIISHSKFSKTYYLVIDNKPLTAKTQSGLEVTYEPASISSTNANNTNDLDQLASFTIADVNNELDAELDRIPLDDDEVPTVTYGIYHSDYLDEPAEWVTYDVKSVPQEAGVFTIRAGAPDLNKDSTGEIFDLDRFPALRGLLI